MKVGKWSLTSAKIPMRNSGCNTPANTVGVFHIISWKFQPKQTMNMFEKFWLSRTSNSLMCFRAGMSAETLHPAALAPALSSGDSCRGDLLRRWHLRREQPKSAGGRHRRLSDIQETVPNRERPPSPLEWRTRSGVSHVKHLPLRCRVLGKFIYVR